MNWTELFIGAVAGALVGEVVGISVTLAFMDRLLKRREYSENYRVRCFAYARTFEIASGLLARLLPDELFVDYPSQRDFGEVPARSPGRSLIRIESADGMSELIDRQASVACGEPLIDLLKGYLTELDTIVMGFGRLNDSNELEGVVALSRALNVFVRSEGDRQDCLTRNGSQIASYLSVLLQAERVVSSLARISRDPGGAGAGRRVDRHDVDFDMPPAMASRFND